MKLFYAPDILRNQVLPEEESGHAVRVLRLQSGDNIEVVDGAQHTDKINTRSTVVR